MQGARVLSRQRAQNLIAVKIERLRAGLAAGQEKGFYGTRFHMPR